MRKTTTFAAVVALALAACGGGQTTNQNIGGNNTDSALAQQPETVSVETVKSNVYADTVFTEDIALKVLQLKNLKGYDYEKPRNANKYASLSATKGEYDEYYADIECFRRKDGAYLAYVAIYSEAEGARTYTENKCYLLKDNQLTPITSNPPIAGHPLDWFSDELGKLDFMLNETFTNGNENVWKIFSDDTSNGDYRVGRQGINTISITPFYDGRAVSPVLCDWNGEDFTRREPFVKNYIHDRSFGPIYCAAKFPDLSGLSEYKTTEKNGKIQLLKKSETVAEFEIKNGYVKDFEVFSPEYQFLQGWGVGMPTEEMYKRFEKIEKDADGNLYVPWFEEVRFYFNNADLQNSDLQNPVFKPNSRITKVRVIGKEPKKAAFALMPKKITVENKDFETN